MHTLRRKLKDRSLRICRSLGLYLCLVALLPIPVQATETAWPVEDPAATVPPTVGLPALTRQVGQVAIGELRTQERLREQMFQTEEPALLRDLKNRYFSSRRFAVEAFLNWSEHAEKTLVALIAGVAQQKRFAQQHWNQWNESFVPSQRPVAKALEGFWAAGRWLEHGGREGSGKGVAEHLRVWRYLLKKEGETLSGRGAARKLDGARDWLVLIRSLRRLLRQERDGVLIKQAMSEVAGLQEGSSEGRWVAQRMSRYRPLDQIVFRSVAFESNFKENNHEISFGNNQK